MTVLLGTVGDTSKAVTPYGAGGISLLERVGDLLVSVDRRILHLGHLVVVVCEGEGGAPSEVFLRAGAEPLGCEQQLNTVVAHLGSIDHQAGETGCGVERLVGEHVLRLLVIVVQSSTQAVVE